MQYKILIYRTVKSLANENQKTDKSSWLTFDSESSLYHYVRKFDYVNSNGARGNHFLEATMTKQSDSRRHKQWYYMGRTYPLTDKRGSTGTYTQYCWSGYLVKDENSRTIDLRLYEKELYKFDYTGYDNLLRKKRHIEHLENMAKWSLRFDDEWEKRHRLLEGKDYWGYYKRPHTMPERRNNCDAEHKPFVRGKRRHLPDPWDDKPMCKEKTWKARTKAKRSWQVNLSTHIDTVWHEKKIYDNELLPEEEGN